MKTLIFPLALALAAVLPVQAELFSPSTVGGAALGAIAGGVIGNNSGGHHGTQGAVIGAVAGGLLGSAYNQSQQRQPVYSSAPAYYPESSYGSYSSGYGYSQPVYYSEPAAPRESYTATSTLLGGVAGAIIGHNDGRHTWQGALIGAGAGYLVGRVIDSSSSRRTAPVSYVRYTPATPVAPQPSQVTIINNYYGNPTPMSSANSMFGR